MVRPVPSCVAGPRKRKVSKVGKAERSASLHRTAPTISIPSTTVRFPCPTSGNSNTRASTCSASFDAPNRVLPRAIAASPTAHQVAPLPDGCAKTTARHLEIRTGTAFPRPPYLLQAAPPLSRVWTAPTLAAAHQTRRADRDSQLHESDPLPSAHDIDCAPSLASGSLHFAGPSEPKRSFPRSVPALSVNAYLEYRLDALVHAF